MIYKFGDLCLDTAKRRLTRDQIPLKLPNLSYKLLEVLVSSSPNLVSQEELITRVWGEKRVISSENLSQRVALLRQSLGDDSQNPAFVETVYGQGFRLIPEVEIIEATILSEPPDSRVGVNNKANQRRRGLVLAVALIAIVGTVYFFVRPLGEQYQRTATQVQHERRSSIAVLPFANLTPDPDYAFFAAGLHDEVLNHLSKLQNLAVISRTSMLRYAETEKSIPEIAKELDVENIIEGSVRYSNNRVRVSIQLVHGASDEQLWSKTYDHALGEIFANSLEKEFAIESDIAKNVARELNLVLSEADLERVEQISSTDLAAFAEYIAAKQVPITIAGWEKATKHYEKAIEIDPEYAAAWIGLADSLEGQVEYGHLDLKASLARRQEVIEKALQLDPLSGEAWMHLTQLQLQQGLIKDPTAHYLKSIELSPNSAQALHLLGSYLTFNGRSDEALPYLEKAVQLNPDSMVKRAKFSRALFYLGRSEDALQNLYRGVQLSPEAPASYRDLCDLLMRLGRLGEAMYWIRIGARLPSTTRYVRNLECQALAALLYDDAAELCFKKLIQDFPRETFDATHVLYMEPSPSELQAAKTRLGDTLLAADHRAMVLSLVRAEEWEPAKRISTNFYPDYFVDKQLDRALEVMPLFVGAVINRGLGNEERASYMFDLAISEGRARDRRFDAEHFRIADLAATALSKDEQAAVDLLKDVYDKGWRQQVWQLRRWPFLDLNGHPEWENLVAKFEADVAIERDWYEKHKEAPVDIERFLN